MRNKELFVIQNISWNCVLKKLFHYRQQAIKAPCLHYQWSCCKQVLLSADKRHFDVILNYASITKRSNENDTLTFEWVKQKVRWMQQFRRSGIFCFSAIKIIIQFPPRFNKCSVQQFLWRTLFSKRVHLTMGGRRRFIADNLVSGMNGRGGGGVGREDCVGL